MPRPPNQTAYSDMLNVFKKGPGPEPRRQTTRPQPRGSTPPLTTSPVGDRAPRSRNPQHHQSSPYNPTNIRESYSGIPVNQPSSSLGSWPVDESAVYEPPDIGSILPIYPRPLTYSAPNDSMMPVAGTSTWMFEIGGEQRYLNVRRYELPEVRCPCGSLVKMLHLPTYVYSTEWVEPPFGVLWNFNNSNYWVAGRAVCTYSYEAQCGTCQVGVKATLHQTQI